MITPIIHKRTRKVLGYVKDFTPNNRTRHKVMFRSHPNTPTLHFGLDGRVKERLEFIRTFGYRPRASLSYAMNYRVKVHYKGKIIPLAIIVHGQRDADIFMKAIGTKASTTWKGLA